MDGSTANSGYTIKLDIFEGPLDLLLHLIRKHEIDVFDIPIAFITQKYLDYLDFMKETNLDMGAEYLDMASYLTLVKSKMMLPTPPDDDDSPLDDGPDPREELVRRLLEYQKYKTAAQDLADRPRAGIDTFTRGATETVESERELANPGLFALIEAFQQIVKRSKPELAHEISVTRLSVSERIQQIADLIRDRKRISLEVLFDGHVSRSTLVVTFMALLEMAKLGLTGLHQAGPHGELYITAKEGLSDTEHSLQDTPVEDL